MERMIVLGLALAAGLAGGTAARAQELVYPPDQP